MTDASPAPRRASGLRRALGFASPLGWGAIGCALAFAGAGLWLGWAEFAGVAAALGAAIATAIPFVLTSPRYEVTIELASERVTVGEPGAGRVVLRGAGSRPSPAVTIELPVGEARAEFRIPRLQVGEYHDELFTVPTERRAVLTLGPVTSVRADPLGLFRREMEWTVPTELFVHPRVALLPSGAPGLMRDLEGLPTRDLADDDVSFHALREYVPGDDLRHVHWRSSARTGAMMIRQFEQTRRSHLVVVLSTRTADYAGDEEFELAVSAAASVALSAMRDGKTVSVLTGDGALPCATPVRLLDAFSGVERRRGAAGIVDAAREVRVLAPNASEALFVTGGRSELGELRTASLRVPPTMRAGGVRAVHGGEPARRVVGETSCLDVDSLDALRRGMLAVSA